VVTPRPADSPAPPVAAPTEVASLKTDLAARTPDTVNTSPAPELTTSPPANPLPMETAAANTDSAFNATFYAVVGGLVVLAALLIAALIFLLKKFKPL
jgi:hypothetical protein